MMRKRLVVLGCSLSCCMGVFCQEGLNLNHLYIQWVVTPEIVDSDYLGLRPYRIGFKKSDEDRIISFRKSDDNVIYDYSPSKLVCPSPPSNLGAEKWVVIPDLKRLEHLFFDEKGVIIYSSTYEIADVNRKVLKLKRISEYLNEDWE